MNSGHRRIHPLRELAHRSDHGIEVTLFWHEGTAKLTVCVFDERRLVYFEFDPSPLHALDAFYHPYSYEPSSSVHHENNQLAA